MTRQEFLLNLTLVTVIGALGYSIYDSHQTEPELRTMISQAGEQDAVQDDGDEASPSTETTFDPTKYKNYPNVGNTDLFKSLIPPTPSPPPPTPKPTDTPNIQMALNAWKVMSVDQGVVAITDVIKERAGAEDFFFEMKVGDTHPIDIGGGQTRLVKLEKTHEDPNSPDLPSATFSMQDTNATRTMKMGEEPGQAPPGKAAEGAPTPPQG